MKEKMPMKNFIVLEYFDEIIQILYTATKQ